MLRFRVTAHLWSPAHSPAVALTLCSGSGGTLWTYYRWGMGGVGWGRDMGVTGVGVVSWGHGRGAVGRVWAGQGRGVGIYRALSCSKPAHSLFR